MTCLAALTLPSGRFHRNGLVGHRGRVKHSILCRSRSLRVASSCSRSEGSCRTRPALSTRLRTRLWSPLYSSDMGRRLDSSMSRCQVLSSNLVSLRGSSWSRSPERPSKRSKRRMRKTRGIKTMKKNLSSLSSRSIQMYPKRLFSAEGRSRSSKRQCLTTITPLRFARSCPSACA